MGKTRKTYRQEVYQTLSSGRVYVLDPDKKFTPKSSAASLLPAPRSVLCRAFCFPLSAFPQRYLFAVGAWSLIVLAATEGWYRLHEQGVKSAYHWTAQLPKTKPGFEEIELSGTAAKKIGHDIGATGKWQDEDGSRWSLYFFRWLPTSIRSILQARVHRPDRCLPATGLRQVSDSGIERFQAGPLTLPFRRYIYEREGRMLYVFFCQWEDGRENQAGLAGSKQAGRLQSVLTGRRKLGQQTLELILEGYPSLEEADQALRQQLPNLIQFESQPVTTGGVSRLGYQPPTSSRKAWTRRWNGTKRTPTEGERQLHRNLRTTEPVGSLDMIKFEFGTGWAEVGT